MNYESAFAHVFGRCESAMAAAPKSTTCSTCHIELPTSLTTCPRCATSLPSPVPHEIATS